MRFTYFESLNPRVLPHSRRLSRAWMYQKAILGGPIAEFRLENALRLIRVVGLEIHTAPDRLLIIPGTCDVDETWRRARRTTREATEREYIGRVAMNQAALDDLAFRRRNVEIGNAIRAARAEAEANLANVKF